jgi:hypothetical protein
MSDPTPDHQPQGDGLSKPDTVATPEGDKEFSPDQPLKLVDDGHQKPTAINTNHV